MGPDDQSSGRSVEGEEAIEQLQSEIVSLRARIVELQAKIAAQTGARTGAPPPALEPDLRAPPRAPALVTPDATHEDASRALHETLRLLHAIVDNSPNSIFAKDAEGRYIVVNAAAAEMFDLTPSDMIGKKDRDFVLPEVAAHFWAKDLEVMNGGEAIQYEEVVRTPVREYDCLTIKFPFLDARGNAAGICGIATDITDRKRAEAARHAFQEHVIAAQQAALRELSTPLVPIADGVLALPIVGGIDSARAQQIMDTLLDGVSRLRARVAILDITGVSVVNAEAAAAIMRAACAARLLGAEVLLTGISPKAAQTLVELGANLSEVVTLGTLQSGIAYALQQHARA